MAEEKLTEEEIDLTCRDEQCGKGTIETRVPVRVITGCWCSQSVAFRCNECGRLHYVNDKEITAVANRSGDRAFFNDGHQYNINAEGKKIRIT